MSAGGTGLSVNFHDLRAVNWVEVRSATARNSTTSSTQHLYLGLRRIAVSTSGMEHVGPLEQMCGLLGLAADDCSNCVQATGDMEKGTYVGIYAEACGVALGFSRLLDNHNGLGLHVLASLACSLCLCTLFANLAQHNEYCHDRLASSVAYPNLHTFHGSAFFVTVAACWCNFAQFILQVLTMHDPAVPFSAGTPLRFICFDPAARCCFGPNACCHRKNYIEVEHKLSGWHSGPSKREGHELLLSDNDDTGSELQARLPFKDELADAGSQLGPAAEPHLNLSSSDVDQPADREAVTGAGTGCTAELHME